MKFRFGLFLDTDDGVLYAAGQRAGYAAYECTIEFGRCATSSEPDEHEDRSHKPVLRVIKGGA